MLTRVITDIVWHCSASANGGMATAWNINEWHRQRNFRRKQSYRERLNFQFDSIGYHGVIHPNGFYQSGRHFDEWGAHVKGSNAHSIGFCAIGTSAFTREAWLTMRSVTIGLVGYLADQMGQYDQVSTPAEAREMANRIGVRIQGHRDYSPDLNGDGIIERDEWFKTCPGFDVATWLAGDMEPLNGHIWTEPDRGAHRARA